MAKMIGPHKMRGTVADLTMRQTEFGNEVGRKPGPTREQVLTQDRFSLTRRNAGEFKGAVKDSALLRQALGDMLLCVRRSSLNSDMNRLLNRVAKSDKRSSYGYRHAGSGDVRLLECFEFNPALSLGDALPVSFTHGLDVQSGVVQLIIPSFMARRKKDIVPEAATHMRIISCAAIVDFEHDTYANSIQASGLLPFNKKTQGVISLTHQLTVEPGEVLMQAAGVEFYRMENG